MLINIEQIKIENRIRKDFGNIQELADDIKQNGLINPPVVISESDGTYTLLTGERRIKAMKLLGYKQVEVRTWKSLDDEQKLNIEISENEARKDFSKSERMEYALKLAKIERLKAEERTKSGKAYPTETFPQGGQGEVRDIVAQKTGIGSGKQFDKEKYIYENQSSLTPEDFADWDEGRLSTNKAYQRVKARIQEQEEQIQAAQKQSQEYVDKLNESQRQISTYKSKAEEAESLRERIQVLQESIAEMERREPEVKTVVQTVVPDDYESLKSSNKILRSDNARMAREYNDRCKELFELKDRLRAVEEDSIRASIEKELERDCNLFCARCDDFIKKVGGYAYLSDKLDSLPDKERRSYIKCVQMINAWAENIILNSNAE